MIPTNRIKEIRRARGMTQTDLAQKAGYNLRSIQKMENGEYSIYDAALSTVLNIAKALGVTVYDLIEDQTDEQSRG